MHTSAKLKIVQKTVGALEHQTSPEKTESKYAVLVSEIEYSSREELRAVLETICRADAQSGKLLLRRVLRRVLRGAGSAGSKYPGIFQACIEDMHAKHCRKKCFGEVPCAELLGRVLVCTVHVQETFLREIKKYMFMKTELSFGVVKHLLLLLKAQKYTGKALLFLFQFYNSFASFRSLEIVGLLFLVFSTDTVLSTIRETYRKEDFFFVLKCIGSVGYTLQHGGEKDKADAVLGLFSSKEVQTALKKCSKYKTYHQSVSLLCTGVLYAMDRPEFSQDALATEMFGMCTGGVPFSLLVSVVKALAGMQSCTPEKKEALCMLGIALFLRTKSVTEESASLLALVLSTAERSRITVPAFKLVQISQVLAQEKELPDVSPILQSMHRVHDTRAVSLIAMKQYRMCRHGGRVCPSYLLLVSARSLSEAEKEAFYKDVLEFVETGECVRVCSAASFFLSLPEPVLERVARALCARSLRDLQFLPVTAQVLSATPSMVCSEKTLCMFMSSSREGFRILHALQKRKLACVFIKESVHKLSTDVFFADGAEKFFYAMQSFPEEASVYHKDVLGRVAARMESSSEAAPVSFCEFEFQIIKALLQRAECSRELLRVCALANTDAFILRVYLSRNDPCAVLACVSALGVYLARFSEACMCLPALERISRHSSCVSLVLACESVLSRACRPSRCVLKHPRVDSQTVSFLLDLVSRYQHAPSLLHALVEGVHLEGGAGTLHPLTCTAVSQVVLEHLSGASAESLKTFACLLDIAPGSYGEVLVRVEELHPPLSAELLILVGKLLKNVVSFAEIEGILSAVDCKYLSARVLDTHTHSLYLSVKILQHRRFKEGARSTLQLVLRKLSVCSADVSLHEKVYELFSTTHIVREEAARELDVQKAAHPSSFLSSLHLPFSCTGASASASAGADTDAWACPDIISVEVPSSLRPYVITEAFTEFAPKCVLQPQTDRCAQVKNHCEFIRSSCDTPFFAQKLMAFFVAESPSAAVRRLKEPCESTFGLLPDVFPLALLLMVRTLPIVLKKKVLEGVGKASQSPCLSQSAVHYLVSALEYVMLHSIHLPEFEYAKAYATQRTVLSLRKLRSPGDTLRFLNGLLHSEDVNELFSFLSYLRNRLDTLDMHLKEATEALSFELEGKYAKAVAVLEASLPDHSALLRLRILSAIKEIGSAEEQMFAVKRHGELEEASRHCAEALGAWGSADTLLKALLPPSSSSADAGSVHPARDVLLEAVQKFEERTAASLRPSMSLQYLRMRQVFAQYKAEDTPFFDLLLRNELIEKGVGYEFAAPRHSEGPLGALFSIALRNKDIGLARGVISVTAQASQKRVFVGKGIKHFAASAGGRKEFDESIELLLQKEEERVWFGQEIEEEAQKAFRMWDRLVFCKSVHLKKRIEMLALCVARCPRKHDPFVLLDLLQEAESTLKDKETGDMLCEALRACSPETWRVCLYEIASLHRKLWEYPPYAELLESVFEHLPEEVSSVFAHVYVQEAGSRSCEGPGASSPQMEKIFAHKGYANRTVLASVLKEISETSTERLLYELKRFQEAEKRTKSTGAGMGWTASFVSQDGASTTQKNLFRLYDIIGSIKKECVYRERSVSEHKTYGAVGMLVSLLQEKASSKVWDVLCVSRINHILSLLGASLPQSVSLTESTLESLKGCLVPSCAATIAKGVKDVEIIPSLQRPRKVTFLCSDGVYRSFLLKKEKHASIERTVSQCFSLFMPAHPIEYDILAPDLSLSTFIPHTLSLKEVVHESRGQKASECGINPRFLLKKEKIAISQLCHDYNRLREIEKLEIYLRVTNFSGAEIKDWITKHSVSYMCYLERVRAFTASYLYSSAVGYLVGLGDRHPGNILLCFGDCTALHIDYADALDTLQTRSSFQEKVSLRLTPMITTAIGADTEEKFLQEMKNMFQAYKEHFYVLESIFSLFFSTRASYRRLSLSEALGGIERKVPADSTAEEEGRKVFRDSTSVESLAQMYIGWMPFW
ncbi:hypothetical protein NECID01_1667 [Nematocida sp. AWRm77]|nr:hypothetical protein NECID01_1667 [Nematocida sp. AWRm77]